MAQKYLCGMQCRLFSFPVRTCVGRLASLGASLMMILCAKVSSAQSQLPNSLELTKDNEINVNWLYGSYVPKEVPLKSLNGDERLKLYIRQTYTTWGVYLK